MHDIHSLSLSRLRIRVRITESVSKYKIEEACKSRFLSTSSARFPALISQLIINRRFYLSAIAVPRRSNSVALMFRAQSAVSGFFPNECALPNSRGRIDKVNRENVGVVK